MMLYAGGCDVYGGGCGVYVGGCDVYAGEGVMCMWGWV